MKKNLLILLIILFVFSSQCARKSKLEINPEERITFMSCSGSGTASR